MKPWIQGIERELTFTRVDFRQGYIPEGEPKRTFTPKRLFHVPTARPTEGTFPSGLLPRVKDWLQSRGHTFEVEDFRDLKAIKPMPDFTQVGLLRPGQSEALVQIAHADMGIIVAATAFGKSFVITQACRMYPTLRIMVVSPSVPVVNSLRRKLEEAVGVDNVGQAGGGKRILGRRVTVTTSKSMMKVDPSQVDLMLFDEVHGVGDNEAGKTVAYYDKCRRFGLTASPVRGDNSEMCMEALFGRFLIEVSYQDAVDMGNVVPIDVYMVRVPGRIRVSNSSYENKRLSYWTNDVRNDLIAKVAKRVPDDEQCLIMVETLEHAVHLHKRLPDYTLVHFGSVQLEYHAYEWRRLSARERSRSKSWVQTGECEFRLATSEDGPELSRYGWICTRMTDKDWTGAARASGREIRMIGRLKSIDELYGREEDPDKDLDAIAPAPTDSIKPGDYYLVRQEEYILDVPKSSLSLTKKEKEQLQIQFEKAELMKVIATTTWKEGVDFEQLPNLIRADGSTSEVRNTQIPGRLSRLYDGKLRGRMIDFRDEFNDWALNRTNRRLALYRGHGWSIKN
jgi:superfamily II DNA or RNA helicase